MSDSDPPIPSKAELERLIEERKNDLPLPEPGPAPSGMGEEAVFEKSHQDHLDRIEEREERIQYIEEKLSERDGQAREGFRGAGFRGRAKDGFDRSR